MRRFFAAAILAMTLAAPGDARTEICSDLWFQRNLVMDQAGYCFESTLGRAVFDNDGCAPDGPTLSAADRTRVAALQGREKALGCAVDTSQSALGLPDLAIRRRLAEQPAPDEFESGCLGWRGPKTPLYAGRSKGLAAVGAVEPGDFVLYAHGAIGAWTYVTTHTADYARYKSAGWLKGGQEAGLCTGWAG